jgi:excisionase family DNA binding protein
MAKDAALPDPIRHLAAKGNALIGSREVARLLDVHQETVYQMARRGELPATRIGGRLKFFADDVLRYLQERQL